MINDARFLAGDFLNIAGEKNGSLFDCGIRIIRNDDVTHVRLVPRTRGRIARVIRGRNDDLTHVRRVPCARWRLAT